MDGRALAQRYADCHNAPWDWEAMRAILHPEFIEEWPQSGETIRGFENKRAILEHYPGGLPEAGVGTRRVVGDDRTVDAVAAAGPIPFLSVVRIVGGGETFTFEGFARYPSADTTHVVSTIEIRDGKVWRATTYFAPPFEAPQWRAPWVNRVDETSR